MAEEDDEISFQRGAVMEVLQKSVDGWWRVRINEQVGLAPATFLKMMEAVEVQSSPVRQPQVVHERFAIEVGNYYSIRDS